MGRSEAKPRPSGLPAVDQVVRDCRTWLAERGELVIGSGCFRAGPYSGSIHCDFGPPTQDKNANQDYALAWWPADGDGPQPRLILALADGLTNSFRSEWAAAVACWEAVRTLVEAGGAMQSEERAKVAFNAAGDAIARLAEEYCRDPEASRPEGQFLSTWKYILKKGGLFQTTLTLAWIDSDRFNLAMLGDGGALWRDYARPTAEKVAFRSVKEAILSRSERRHSDCILAACNLESQQVHALGPAEPHVLEFDCWRQESIDGPFLGAFFTDGIGRGIGATPLGLLDELDACKAADAENDAWEFIARSIRDRPKDFDDNLTLAVIRG
jgi:hypothetical protein